MKTVSKDNLTIWLLLCEIKTYIYSTLSRSHLQSPIVDICFGQVTRWDNLTNFDHYSAIRFLPINLVTRSGAPLAPRGLGWREVRGELKITVKEAACWWPFPSLQKNPRLESLVHTTWDIFENATVFIRLSVDEAFIHYRESSQKIRIVM